MPKMRFICFALFVFVFSAHSIFAENFAKGELLVKYKNGTASAAASLLNTQVGATVLEEFPALKWQRVKLPESLSVEDAVSIYQKAVEIEAVQPNYYYHLAATPNDTRFSELYGMQKISAPAAWDLTTGSANTVVAVIDTGVKYTHEDLAANMWTNSGEINGNGIDDDGNGFIDDFYGYDFFSNDANPMDENGHGTHVSGTIGATGNNSLGVVGVNWNVRIMAIKIYNSTGFGTTSAMLINAYNYVRIMKERGVNIRVTNNSYSGCDEACGYDQATKDALDALGNANVLNVFAAGNDSRNIETNPAFPASYTSPSVLTAAASTSTDAKSGFSNFGTTSVDVAAPGSGILSTVINSSNYGNLSGTSMASPHTAGAAALLSSYNPNLTAASLKATLMNTVDALPQWNGIVKTGGRINVANALQNQTVCNFNLSAQSIQVTSSGANGSVNVTAATNCDYSVRSNVNWIVVNSANVGSANSTVAFTVQANNLPDVQRTGTISIGDQTFTIVQGTPFLARKPLLDFDGDGRTDFSAIQNTNGGMLWHNYRSVTGYSATNFGVFADDIPVSNDFDGDGKSDIAVWRNSTGVFYVLNSSANTFQIFQFGSSGDNPLISQDFDGDSKTDFAVTRRQNGKLVWYIALSTGGFRIQQFGNETDKPLRGDYDGDGKADLAVYRPASDSPANTFYVLRSLDNGLIAAPFGISTTDRIVPADYDGDGKTDIAVWRETTGVWHYLKSSDSSYNTFQFGTSGDLPTPGDYDGDGRADFSVWRLNQTANQSGIFYIYSALSGYSAFGWGNSDMKIPGNLLGSQ